jgi:hypothetical protein
MVEEKVQGTLKEHESGGVKCTSELREYLVGARFFTPIQAGPGAHSTSYKMDTVSFPGVNLSGLGVHPPPTSTAKVNP